MRRSGLSIALAAAVLAAAPAFAQEPAPGTETGFPKDWRFSVQPYFFLSGVAGSVTADPLTFPINSNFSDLLDNVQISAFLAFVAERGRWGTYADIQYVSLKGEGAGDRLPASLELDNLIAEADLTLRPTNAPTLKFLAGMRVYSIDQTLTIGEQEPLTANVTVYDPIVGAVGTWDLSRAWGFFVRGDIGGFGVSSEFTYQMMVQFLWRVSDTIGIPMGYRVLGYQINSGDVVTDTRMAGLVLGLHIRF